MFSDTTVIQGLIERLEAFQIELVGVSHCTGFKAAAALAHHFGRRFAMASVGAHFQFGA